MPVPTHFKFVFRGIFETTPETWSFSMKFSRDNPAGPDAQVSDIDEGAVTTAVDTFFGSASAGIPSRCVLTDWRAYEIGTDGLMENNPLIHLMADDSVRGATGTIYPPQIAAVVTTVGANRGPGRFGRFYLPTALPMELTGLRMSATVATNAMELTSTFMKDVSNAIDLEGTQSSEGLNISAVAAGSRQAIDHLEMGRVFDTLRNRRKSLLEERVETGHIDW